MRYDSCPCCPGLPELSARSSVVQSMSWSASRIPVRLRLRIALVAALAVGVVAGCANPHLAPVEQRPAIPAARAASGGSGARTAIEAGRAASYTVKHGDTLYQIALDNGVDYRELAAWNHLGNVNRIYAGQVLRLAAPGQPAAGTELASTSTAPASVTQSGESQAGMTQGGESQAGMAQRGVTTAPLQTVAPVVAMPMPSTPPSSAMSRPTVGAPPTVSSAAPGAVPGAVPSQVAAAAPVASGMVKSSPKAIKEPYSDRALRELTRNASLVPAPPVGAVPAAGTALAAAASTATPSTVAPAGDDVLNWMWPAKGKVVTEFSDAANLKGIDIAGTAGQPVYASAAGRVVYAGSGLRGYGKLIIIKHNATYLSAYAHNSAILVKEGQQVARGQEIAEMGDTDANRVNLHFEIRRFGKPMDPEKYLPPA